MTLEFPAGDRQGRTSSRETTEAVNEHGERKWGRGEAGGAGREAVEHASRCWGRRDYTRHTRSPRTVTDWMERRRERRLYQLSALG